MDAYLHEQAAKGFAARALQLDTELTSLEAEHCRIVATMRVLQREAKELTEWNAKLCALLQEVSLFLDGEPYLVRNDSNDDAVDEHVESCQEMIARIKKELTH